MIAAGTIIAGRYRITERLAKGGMAEVYAAVEDGSGAEVVVKTPLGSALRRGDLLKLFKREASLMSRIRSAHVPRFYGYFDADTQPFIVCERLVGETLADRMKRARVLTLADLGPIVEQVLMGLGDAHAAGILHRDLSPHNVFLTRAPEQAKLIDFGVGKPLEDPEPMTPADATIGSFAYMAPEQWLDPSKVDARTDLYALGTIIFHAPDGRPSLPGEERHAAPRHQARLRRPFDQRGHACAIPYERRRVRGPCARAKPRGPVPVR